ncbi:MAG: response regulator [Bacteroidetes bacterium]|nr:response regulator [Bacteroidota bacterium]
MKKALVVDDAESNRLIIGAIVSEFAIGVIYAEDGNEAVNKFAAAIPDIVFIDQIMPEKNGSDAIKQMKLIAPNVPALLMSSLINPDEIREIAHSCGADDFLPKPISSKIIETMLKKYKVIA